MGELFRPSDLIELRAKKRNVGVVGSGVHSDHAAPIREARKQIMSLDTEAVWVSLQQIRPDYPATPFIKGAESIGNDDITGWRWIFIDVGTTAEGDVPTASEKEAAQLDAKAVKKILVDNGIPVTTADSGDGFHFLVPFVAERSAETDSLVKRALASIPFTVPDSRSGNRLTTLPASTLQRVAP